jgi:hypothetical protein
MTADLAISGEPGDIFPNGACSVTLALATGWWFSPCPSVSCNNKTDRHDITEILLKVALNTIKPI